MGSTVSLSEHSTLFGEDRKKRVPSRLQGVHIGAADPKADTVVDCQDMNRSLEFLCETVKSRIEKAE